MPVAPSALPPALSDAPFTITQAREAGLTRARLRAGDLAAPTTGVRVPRRAEDALLVRARAFAAALPADTAFSHLTAARLHGLPTPARWVPSEPLDVMRPTDRPRLKRHGVRSHRGLERRYVAHLSGLRVTEPLDAWADLAPSLALEDLVAMGDALLRDPTGLRLKDVERCAADREGRGSRTLRHAVSLLRAGSASAWESKARLTFHRWGLPEPELNVDVYAASGRWARPDFVWREQRVVAEYDGDQHRTDRRAWQYERERRAGLEDEDWRYVEMTALSFVGRRERAALRSRLERLLL